MRYNIKKLTFNQGSTDPKPAIFYKEMYGRGEVQALPPGRGFKGKVLIPLEAHTPKVIPVELFLAMVLSFYGG